MIQSHKWFIKLLKQKIYIQTQQKCKAICACYAQSKVYTCLRQKQRGGPVLFRVSTFHFLQLIPALLEGTVVPMCGHQLGDFLIYFLVPSCAVELPLYPFFGHQREERLDLLRK